LARWVWKKIKNRHAQGDDLEGVEQRSVARLCLLYLPEVFIQRREELMSRREIGPGSHCSEAVSYH
jgi:hypothetical protein